MIYNIITYYLTNYYVKRNYVKCDMKNEKFQLILSGEKQTVCSEIKLFSLRLRMKQEQNSTYR